MLVFYSHYKIYKLHFALLKQSPNIEVNIFLLKIYILALAIDMLYIYTIETNIIHFSKDK